jgi:hypothetical protein
VVFLARRVVDRAPNHTSEKWAQWAIAIWGTISTYWRASHAPFERKAKIKAFAGGLDLGNEKYCSFVNLI